MVDLCVDGGVPWNGTGVYRSSDRGVPNEGKEINNKLNNIIKNSLISQSV